MAKFTPEEIEYLQSMRLGRLATIDSGGELHVVPVGFHYDPEAEAIDIGGHNLILTKKFRDAVRHKRVAFVVDDVLPPWKPRFVEVRGTVKHIPRGGAMFGPGFAADILRIVPAYVVSFGLGAESGTRMHGRRVA